MNVNIKVIPHKDQKYNTIGDWWYNTDGDETVLEIRVSEIKEMPFAQNLVAVHEYIEATLCRDSGVNEKKVTQFDEQFEKLREAYPDIIKDMEPGDMTSAPYFREHQIATDIEKQLAAYLRIPWMKYNALINKICAPSAGKNPLI